MSFYFLFFSFLVDFRNRQRRDRTQTYYGKHQLSRSVPKPVGQSEAFEQNDLCRVQNSADRRRTAVSEEDQGNQKYQVNRNRNRAGRV